MTAADLGPWLDVEGCFNVRDAGGWATADGATMRTGVLFRADEPHRMTPSGRAVIDGLGLRAVIDLRSPRHFDRGDGFLEAPLTFNVPVVDRVIVNAAPRRVDGPVDIADLYDEMVEDRRDDVVRAVELIAEHIVDGPVLVHCMAGKDRTGIVVALVQAAIGVPLGSIVEEYVRSDGPTRRRRVAMIADPHPGDPDVANATELIWTAPAQTMELFATRAVARHGSLEAWPRAIGVSDRALHALRDHLLDPRPAAT
ncbi:MAG: tyrosine-protein phosphatase [Ilumatobacteraceae bacterium]